MIGSTELMIILIVVLVLFGSSAIPKFAKSLGQAKAEFQKAMKDGEEDTKSNTKPSDEKQA